MQEGMRAKSHGPPVGDHVQLPDSAIGARWRPTMSEQDPKAVVDANDPLEYARLLIDSVDEDMEKSASVWLLKAIAIAQIDLAQTARDSLTNAIGRDNAMMTAIGTQTSLMGKVAENDDRRTKAYEQPSLQMGPFNIPIPLPNIAMEARAVLNSESIIPDPEDACECGHFSGQHIQGDGHCLGARCSCEAFVPSEIP
jgi:hypothetical protein